MRNRDRMQVGGRDVGAMALADRIERDIGRAIGDFGLIAEGDRILVAVSGGKDSLCLLHFLKRFQKKAPVSFELLAVNLDQGQPGFPDQILPQLFAEWDVAFHIERQNTYSIVLEKTPEGGTFCAVCSRLRRGILYRVAREHGCNKLALGHHREDLLATFLMNAFFSGKLATMPPVYTIEEGDLQVVRPLYAVPEERLAEYAAVMQWPIVPCNLCGSQEGMKRSAMQDLLKELEVKHPGVRESLLGALRHPHPNMLLAPELWSSPEAAQPHRDRVAT